MNFLDAVKIWKKLGPQVDGYLDRFERDGDPVADAEMTWSEFWVFLQRFPQLDVFEDVPGDIIIGLEGKGFSVGSRYIKILQ